MTSIAESDIALSSRHDYLEEQIQHESLRIVYVDRDGERKEVELEAPEERPANVEELLDRNDPVIISARAFALQARATETVVQQSMEMSRAVSGKPTTVPITPDEDELGPEEQAKIRLLEAMMEQLTGKKSEFKIQLFDPEKGEDDISDETKELAAVDPNAPSREVDATADESGEGEGFALIYEYHESYTERESSMFNAQGTIKTSDGKEIAFSLDLNLHREFHQEANLRLTAGDEALIDPLVINFDGKGAELTSERFSFDLNADGTEEDIPFVRAGSGLLAIDLNNDGKINDGSELFGPSTGNGFQELAAHDSDGNGFIDSNDESFDQLRVITNDGNNNRITKTLEDAGVAAVYTRSANTAFSLKDDENILQGQVVRTGVFLGADDTVGVVQQIDLAV